MRFICPNCENIPYATNDIVNAIMECTQIGIPVEIVISCPICRFKRVKGGEPDIDMYKCEDEGVEETIILNFGRDYNDQYDRNLPIFEAAL